jgi:hypothetical protein
LQVIVLPWYWFLYLLQQLLAFKQMICFFVWLYQEPEVAFGWGAASNSDARDFVEVAYGILELLRTHEANQEQVCSIPW